MASFHYTAVDRVGRRARGGIEAMNEVDLELRLKHMGLDLINYKEVRRYRGGLGGGKITRADLITFCFHMDQISRAGVPLQEGLLALRDSMDNPRFREVVAGVLEDMEGGKLLSQGLASYPDVFDNLFVSLIRAGEETGNLTEVFESLGSSLKWQDELASQTKRLMIYPAVAALVVSAVIVFLLIYLVPKLAGLLKSFGQTLPLPTRIVVFLSDLFVNYWYLIFGLPIVAAIAVAMILQRSEYARYLVDYAKLNLPVVGPILRKIILARFASFFAMMYQAGITVLEAIRISEGIVDNRVVRDAVQRAGQQISAGSGLSDAFQDLGMFPPLVIRMLRVGENTGALDKSLQTVNYFYTRDVRESIDNGLKLLEPILILLLGLILLGIMIAVLFPIYDTIGKVKVF